ncbi:MAG: DUF4342 domain-containing protein [Anaerolineae bacterium]|jgi:hypothetical protein|nr:DUF4342 domain-containing protein [Anaerolineae bacterium]
MSDENKSTDNKKKTVSEEIEGVGNQVVERVQDVIRQGNVRRLIVKTADDKVIIDTTLTLGAAAGGVLGLMLGWPILVITTLAAIVARVKVEIIREVTDEDVKAKKKVEINDKDA